MASNKNPNRASHRRLAEQELERAEQTLVRAEEHAGKDHFSRALTDGVMAVSLGSVAVAEAEHAQEAKLALAAKQTVRRAGNLLLACVAGVERDAGSGDSFGCARALASNSSLANPRQPEVTPLFLIRTYSSSLLTGADEIYLVINTGGEVMDAVTTESEDFGPLEDVGYGNLGILELDVSGGQFRKLKKLSTRLSEVSQTRPTYRPGKGRSGGDPRSPVRVGPRAAAVRNSTKRKLMR